MQTIVFLVDAQADKTRLDAFLAPLLDVSRSNIKTQLEAGNVQVNAQVVQKAGFLLKQGDKVEVTVTEPQTISARPQEIPLDIVYEDDDVVVVNKPQGLVTHPATGTPDGTLVNALMFHIKNLSSINGVIRPGIVHRLDKDTSGLLVVAKNDKAHQSLAKQIETKQAKRIYHALVDGNIKEDSGVIDAPIARSKRDRKKMAVDPAGRQATTEFLVLERFGDYTLVEFSLKTGRTHQIRVHANHIHHPVVGDVLYHGSNKFKQNGQLLHAARLSFLHPATGEALTFLANRPGYFEEVLTKLRNRH